MKRLKSGDTVEVIVGAAKGKRGKILRLDREKGLVTVQGINLRYKHIRRSQKYPQGGRIQVEAPLHVSNVMLLDPNSDAPSRTRVELGKKNEKKRVSVKSGKPI